MPVSPAAEIQTLIRARYPLIYVVSWEESRVERVLAELARAQGKRFFHWTCTAGLSDEGGAANKDLAEPKAILDFIASSGDRALFVLKDFHPFLQDPKIVRRVRDLVASLKNTYKSLLILSPQLTVPLELEKDMTVVEYGLPDEKEVMDTFKDAVRSASQGGARFEIDLSPEDMEKMAQAAMGMTLSEIESALAKAIVLDAKLSAADVEVILEEKKQVIRKSRLLEYFEVDEAFSQIGGLDVLKDWLAKRGGAFSSKARAFGLPEPKGVLLLGVQGCGKSLSCKALSALWKLPLLRLDMGAVFGGFVGQSEENMRRAIKTAEAVSPCILWLDEIEKGLAGTGSSNTSDAGTTARVFSTFLTWLQEKKRPVFVAATANNIRLLPPELLRKGRLDEIFFIDLPSHAERRDIFAIHLSKKKRDPAPFPLDSLAASTPGFSGAEIEQVVVSALHEAFHRGGELSAGDLEKAVRETVPLSVTMSEEIDDLRRWASTRARPASTPQ